MALLGLPLGFFLATTGLGLLVERIATVRLPNGLLAPLGFCAATSLLLATFRLGAGLTVAGALLVTGAVAGFALARADLPGRLNPGWPGVAALAVYGLYAAPVLLSGNWTWSGYNFLNDTAVQFLLIDHLKSAGTDVGSLPGTTGGAVLATYLDTGYPLGTHAFAGTLSGLLGSGPEVIYQPYVSAMAAVAAMALAVLAGRTVFSVRTGALVGAVAMAANLTYNTGLQGSIKEIGVIATVATAAALGRELVASRRPTTLAVVLGVALAAILSVYSAAGIPYVAAVGATLALVVVLAHGRDALRPRWIAAGAVACVVPALLAAPTIASIIDFYRVASVVVDATAPAGSGLGQLAAPLPLLQVGGIWLDGAYQTPIAPSRAATATTFGLWLVVVLAVASLVEIARRRCPEALLALVPAALTAAVVAPGVTPYADAKLLAIMSPGVVIAAAIGLLALSRLLRPAGPILAIGLAAALTGAVALSDAYALHDSKIAPRERMLALREAADHRAGGGLVLFNEFEEFAKYFGSGAVLNASTEPITPRQVQLRQPDNLYGQFFDLDLQTLEYVEGFPSIITRRSPAASRPPARYRRVFANRFYEAWARRPGPRTVAHLPLQRLDDATARASCEDVRKLVGQVRGRSPGAHLVAAHVPPAARLDVLSAERSPGLVPDGGVPGAVTAISPGYARGRVVIERTGTYRAWVRGSFPRATHVLVDGVRRLTVEGTNTPGQWLGDVALRLQAGAHRVEVRVPGGALEPGDGAAVTIGPVVFVADEPRRLETVPLARWRSLCGRELDWIELVEPVGRRPLR